MAMDNIPIPNIIHYLNPTQHYDLQFNIIDWSVSHCALGRAVDQGKAVDMGEP